MSAPLPTQAALQYEAVAGKCLLIHDEAIIDIIAELCVLHLQDNHVRTC